MNGLRAFLGGPKQIFFYNNFFVNRGYRNNWSMQYAQPFCRHGDIFKKKDINE